MIYIIIISLLLDGLIINLIPSYFNNLNYFYPMITLTLISILGLFLKKEKYYKTSLIIGLIYDLLYSSLFLYHTLFFLFISKINYKIIKVLKNNLILALGLFLIDLFMYEVSNYLIIKISNYQVISINDLLYKFSHSLLLNILLLFVYYFLLGKVIFKHKM